MFHAAASREPGPAGVPLPNPLRVLLVEDSPDDAELIAGELARGGWAASIERVQTAQEMREALDRAPFDVVISDYSLPLFSGPAALAVWKQRGLDFPFIVCSGSIGEEQATSMLKAGASDFVLKDRLARLGPAIERELREVASREALRRSERERAAAHAALARSDRLFQDLFESAPDATFLLSADDVVRVVNRQALRLFGRTEASVIGQPIERLVPTLADALAALRASGPREGDQSDPVAGLGTREPDESFPVEISLSRLTNDIETIVVSVRDVSERHRLEEQLRQTQKMEAIGRLASGVAHDFNNILGVIIGNAQMLMRELPPEGRPRTRAEQILTASERGVGLTRQLLAFSRRQAVRPTVLDFNETVATISSLLCRLVGEDVSFEFRRQDPLGLVRADRTELEQVLMNLAVNARDAMPHGGRLLVETSNELVDEAFVRGLPDAVAGNYVCVSVSDTGHGMSKEIQHRVFEPFFTTKAAGQGTGLGLATVYAIVRRSQGFVHLYSEVGHGTTFRIYLPLVIGDVEPAAGVAVPARGAETLLLMEDDPVLRELIRELLEDNGYRVIVAETLERALEAAHGPGALDLLVTDVVMPGLNGRQLADRLKEARPGLRVLYMSGYTAEIVGQRGVIESGAAFISKPFTEETLTQGVRQALDGPET
jgi:two-component system cell cycle sensor histidine kinase/response regulator CckA